MAYLDDKILKGGEITKTGDFCSVSTFYIMLVPKNEIYFNIEIINAKLSKTEEMTEFPFIVGVWNPVVLNKIKIKKEILDKYRIFWGG